MDEDGFIESAAFPLRKPNIEVFDLLPPATLRRQRRWYQRKRWSPATGAAADRAMGIVTGAEVPQELFDNVVDNLVLWGNDKVMASKQQLGWISLICR